MRLGNGPGRRTLAVVREAAKKKGVSEERVFWFADNDEEEGGEWCTGLSELVEEGKGVMEESYPRQGPPKSSPATLTTPPPPPPPLTPTASCAPATRAPSLPTAQLTIHDPHQGDDQGQGRAGSPPPSSRDLLLGHRRRRHRRLMPASGPLRFVVLAPRGNNSPSGKILRRIPREEYNKSVGVSSAKL
ncbi:hypothetical protein MY11210_003397 [Beauveria gryllotalpidicola]